MTSELERALATMMKQEGLPTPECQVQLIPGRKYAFDFAFPDHKLAIEVEGGAFIGGRHVRGTGFESGCEKHSLAAALGWRVIRVTGRQIYDGKATEWIKAALVQSGTIEKVLRG